MTAVSLQLLEESSKALPGGPALAVQLSPGSSAAGSGAVGVPQSDSPSPREELPGAPLPPWSRAAVTFKTTHDPRKSLGHRACSILADAENRVPGSRLPGAEPADVSLRPRIDPEVLPGPRRRRRRGGTGAHPGARALPAELGLGAGGARCRRPPPTWPRRARRWRCWCSGW